ncbi:MAG: HAD family hydrolase [Synechococcaceae cyanobacterium]|nr:HAD family hydrolase [Synechococcaceae cyanobacterium]
MRCQVVSFDFDGTLVLSNAIKKQGFLVLASEFRGGSESMQTILGQPDCGNRYQIFNRFCQELSLYNPDLPARLAARYGSWCEQQILLAPSRAGADLLLAFLAQTAVPIYLCSATPHEALVRIIRRRYPPSLFCGVYGDPCRKQDAFARILQRQGCPPEQLLHIGDSADDHRAAADVGCRFIAVAGHGLDQMQPDPCVDDLEELIPWLQCVPSAAVALRAESAGVG